MSLVQSPSFCADWICNCSHRVFSSLRFFTEITPRRLPTKVAMDEHRSVSLLMWTSRHLRLGLNRCWCPTDLVIVLIFVAIMSLIRFFGSTAYVINYYVEMIGSQIQRRLFARRKVGEQSKLRRREVGRGVGGAQKEVPEEKEGEERDGESVSLSGGTGVGGYSRDWIGVRSRSDFSFCSSFFTLRSFFNLSLLAAISAEFCSFCTYPPKYLSLPLSSFLTLCT